MSIEHSTASGMGIGIQASALSGASAVIDVANSRITYSSTGVPILAGGEIFSRVNNTLEAP
jgi:hypothetical protein